MNDSTLQVEDAANADVDAALGSIDQARYRGLALLILAVIGLVGALYFARGFFVPLLIGILGSYTLRPMVDRLQSRYLPRALASALVLALLGGGATWVAYAVSGQAAVMIEKLPEAARKLRQSQSLSRQHVPTPLQNVQEAANELQRVAADAAQKPGIRTAARTEAEPSSWLQNYAIAQSTLLLAVLAQMPIVLLLTYFLLASGDHFRRKLVQFVGPTLSRKKDALRTLIEIDTQVQRYLLVTLASNALIGVLTWLAFLALGLEQAGAWGVLAGVLHFVPYLGAVAMAFAAGVAGYLQFGSLLPALGVAAVASLIGGAIGMGFMPWLQSRYAGVNAAVLFIALLFFGWLWGVAGLLLGAPLIAIAKVICDRVAALQPAGELLGR
jgi:predicted PurR-regulated permease PerM